MTGTVRLDEWSLVYEAEAAVEAAQGCVSLPTLWPTMTCPHTGQVGRGRPATDDWSLMRSDDHRQMWPKERLERRRLYGKPPTQPRKKICSGLHWFRGSDAVVGCPVSSIRRASSDQRRHQASRAPKWRRVETMTRTYGSSDFPSRGARSDEDISATSPQAAPHGSHEQSSNSCRGW